LELHTDEDKELIADFLNACIAQENISTNTKKVYLSSLVYLSRHLGNKKSFRDMTNDDLFDYLNSLRRPAALDPDQRWINTRNQRAMVFSKFLDGCISKTKS
jgi:site-specific recombinase XerD